ATLPKTSIDLLKKSSLKLINALNIYGGCNVQFALNPNTEEYYLIEVNPRVSRSSALASKATGFPIAYITSKIAVGYNLDELEIQGNKASQEPQVDYSVIKMPRFYFDKFKDTSNKLGTQMKATGEIMALGKTYQEAFLKALDSLDNGSDYLTSFDKSNEELLECITKPDDQRIYMILQLLRNGISVEKIVEKTKITSYFIEELSKVVAFEKELKLEKDIITSAKEMGMSDKVIAAFINSDEQSIRKYRINNKIIPHYAMVDSCLKNKEAIPYYYSTYHKSDITIDNSKQSILVIGSGPIRIGQGIEFDYATVHCIKTIKDMGYEAIVINNNPETISTDYRISDKLYFEPLNYEKVKDVIDKEQPIGVIIQLGGQTAINLGDMLTKAGVKILGTSYKSIDIAENRNLFEQVLQDNNIKQPKGKTISNKKQGLEVAHEIGYPLLVRPSFVLGGQAMRIVNNDSDLINYLDNVDIISESKPVLLDKYIKGKEVELDAISDGENVLIPGLMEHIEKTGVHSGDSISVYPTFSLSNEVIKEIIDITTKIGLALNIIGLYNIQFIVDELDNVYIIELNPRASRSVPFISKSTGVNVSELATRIILGEKLYQHGLVQPIDKRFYVKAPTFSFSKIEGLDTNLGPEMKSTGEAIGYDYTLNKALYKALQASGMKIKDYGTIFITVADEDKKEALKIAKRFYQLGFNIVATTNTAKFLKENGLKTKTLAKISEGSNEIIDWISNDYIKYIINTQSVGNDNENSDGYIIRTHAASNNITTFTSLDTVNVLLTILEERDINVEAI
ncbi:MAG: carbamoyl-phosphate synthase large subunit, partial [Erysipelotrichales bacterium]